MSDTTPTRAASVAPSEPYQPRGLLHDTWVIARRGLTHLVLQPEQLTDATTQRETLFKGETLRGLLLTSYGFSEFGVKGRQVEVVSFIVAALLFLLSIAGFVHALRTPRNAAFAAPEPVATT